MKKQGIRVPGIGHRIKSKDNRDKRVELLIAYARRFFPATKYLNYALVRTGNLYTNFRACPCAQMSAYMRLELRDRTPLFHHTPSICRCLGSTCGPLATVLWTGSVLQRAA